MRAQLSAAMAGIALALAAPALPRPLTAQTVGFEAAAAAVPDFGGLRPALGVAGYLPLSDRFLLSATYTHWTGSSSAAGDRFGNNAATAVGLARIFGEYAHDSGWLGAGAGTYQQVHPALTGDETRWRGTFVVTGMLEHPVSRNVGVYLRGDAGFPWTGSGGTLGLVRLGVSATLE